MQNTQLFHNPTPQSKIHKTTNTGFRKLRSKILPRFLLNSGRILVICSMLMPNLRLNVAFAATESPDLLATMKNRPAVDPIPNSRPNIPRAEPRTGERPGQSGVFAPGILPATTTSTLPLGMPVEEATPRPYQAMFIENVGQFDNEEKFRVDDVDKKIQLGEDGIWFSILDPVEMNNINLYKDSGSSQNGDTSGNGELLEEPINGVHLNLQFNDANPQPKIEGIDRKETTVSYLIGNDPDHWFTNVPVWGGARYVDLYPGIDLEVRDGGNSQLDMQMVVKDNLKAFINRNDKLKGRDKKGISYQILGADDVELSNDKINLTTNIGSFSIPSIAMVDSDGEAIINDGGFQLNDGNRVSLVDPDGNPSSLTSSQDQTGVENATQSTPTESVVPLLPPTLIPNLDQLTPSPLPTGETTLDTPVITPTATFPATTTQPNSDILTIVPSKTPIQEQATSVPARSSTLLPPEMLSQLPVAQSATEIFGYRQNGPIQSVSYHSIQGENSTKPGFKNAHQLSGIQDLSYSTFIGLGEGKAIAVDGDGAAYISGMIWSSNFPHSAGAFQIVSHGSEEVFITKLKPDGSDIEYSTYLGGSDKDHVNGIAVDQNGYAFIVGQTYSADYPITMGSCLLTDATITGLNANGTAPIYSRCLGGSNGEQGLGISLDKQSNAYIVGQTMSRDFPLLNPVQNTHGGSLYDGFVTKLNSSGGIVYSTYLGGSRDDCEIDLDLRECTIAVDISGSAYIAGETLSTNFPPPGVDSSNYNGGLDGFLVKLSPDGGRIMYSSRFGGSGTDCIVRCAVKLDTAGNVYVVGSTTSSDFSLHQVLGPIQGEGTHS
jgi:hypothetical protein